MNLKEKGNKGEEYAAGFLKNLGYNVIRKNFRWQRGEIDIIARFNCILIFVEVKTWEYYNISDMEYALNSKKQKRIIMTSQYYLSKHPEYRNFRVRYDIILIKNKMTEVEHFINAFTETGVV